MGARRDPYAIADAATGNAWKTGVDELGRVWQQGMYVSGAIQTPADLATFTPPLADAERFF